MQFKVEQIANFRSWNRPKHHLSIHSDTHNIFGAIPNRNAAPDTERNTYKTSAIFVCRVLEKCWKLVQPKARHAISLNEITTNQEALVALAHDEAS